MHRWNFGWQRREIMPPDDPRRANLQLPNKYSQRALSAFLPKRPKKPDTAFSLFMKEYSDEFNRAPEQTANTRYVVVARTAWNNLTEVRKQEFRARAQAENADKRRALELWYKMRNMLRKPPNAYCIFTKEAWTNKDPNDQSTVVEFGARQSQAWRGMDGVAKAPYIQRAGELLARHRQMFQTLQVGGNIIPFLENGEAYELEQGGDGIIAQNAQNEDEADGDGVIAQDAQDEDEVFAENAQDEDGVIDQDAQDEDEADFDDADGDEEMEDF